MNRRVFLAAPPFFRLAHQSFSLDKYPLSLGYLAAAVKLRTGWSVSVCNADFSPSGEVPGVTQMTGAGFREYRRCLGDASSPVWRQFRDVVAGAAPDVVGITTTSPTFASAKVAARIVKHLDPRILVVMGGPHPTVAGPQVLEECAEADVCVIGEGEDTIVELLEAIERGADLAAVPGVICRTGRIAHPAAPRVPIADLDSLGMPHQFAPEALVDYPLYPKKAFRYVMATRGCPRNCFFCGSRGTWGRRVRFRSPEHVAAELRSLQATGLRFVHFDDDLFGVTRRYLFDLCQAISARCPGLHWSCETHVTLISPPTLEAMQAAGCYMIQLGIESGNDRVLAAMRKGYTVEEAFDRCALIRQYGLGLEVFFLVGLPHETEASLMDTLQAIERIDCNKVIYSIFTPYPGTEAFEYCRDTGLIGPEYDPAMHHCGSPENCFSLSIRPDRFRAIASRIERLVDDKNAEARTQKASRYTEWFGEDAAPESQPAPAREAV